MQILDIIFSRCPRTIRVPILCNTQENVEDLESLRLAAVSVWSWIAELRNRRLQVRLLQAAILVTPPFVFTYRDPVAAILILICAKSWQHLVARCQPLPTPTQIFPQIFVSG